MKNQTLLFILFVFFASCSDNDEENNLATVSQVSTDNLSAYQLKISENTWDWTDPINYTYAYIQGIGKIPISCPFTTESSANKDLSFIIQSKDYLKPQGWVLLDKVFGNEAQYAETTYPYFILYNKYRGIIRLFVFNRSNFQNQKALISLKYFSPNKSGLLTYSNEYPLPASVYLKNDKTDNAMNYVDDYYTSSWFVTDFPVAFDKNVNKNENYTLEFKVYSDITSILDMAGVFKFETKSRGMLGAKDNSSSVKDFSGKVISKMNEINKMADGLKKVNDAVKKKDGGSGSEKLKDNLQKSENSIINGSFANTLKDVQSIVSGINGVAGFAISVFDFFNGKSNSSAPTSVQLMPTVSEGTMQMNGTISTQVNAARYVLQQSGTNHKNNDGSINIDGLPFYDEPLGIFCLEEMPKLEYIHYRTNYESLSGVNKTTVYSCILFKDDIKIGVNKASGLEYVSGTAQLVSSCKSLKDENYVDIDDMLYGDNAPCILLKADTIVKFATKPLDIKQFKNTAFLTKNTEKVYLKLTLIFKPQNTKDDQTPVVLSQMYKLTDFTMIADYRPSQSFWPEQELTTVQSSKGKKTFGNALKLTYY